MNQDQFNQLVDDATHAVNNLIPDAILAKLTQDQQSDLLVRINDAISPILSEITKT